MTSFAIGLPPRGTPAMRSATFPKRGGFLEAVYQEALEIEFKKRNIPYEREKELKIVYDGIELKQTYKADFVCFGKIIVELKAVSTLDDAHRSQVYNYLHAIGHKLGLLYNFGCSDGLEKDRIIIR